MLPTRPRASPAPPSEASHEGIGQSLSSLPPTERGPMEAGSGLFALLSHDRRRRQMVLREGWTGPASALRQPERLLASEAAHRVVPVEGSESLRMALQRPPRHAMTREDRMFHASLFCLTVVVLVIRGALYGPAQVAAGVLVIGVGIGVTCCLAMMADGR